MKNHLPEFIDLLKKEDMHETVIKSFKKYYNKLIQGATGKLTKEEIAVPSDEKISKFNQLPEAEDVPFEKLAVIKLNGGLGTSMGLKKVKSLLQVKDDYTFLDVIAKQIKYLNQKYDEQIPLLFMNSFNTRKDTLEFMEKYPEIKTKDLPLDFVQNKFPKIRQDNFAPLRSENKRLNWNPPGHGEIYMVMQITGIIDELLENGIEYIFISNSDNLGAIVEPRILNYFAKNEIPFLMEVCKRTEMDKKGGHLAETKDGKLVLREIAQCPEEELHVFTDISKYKYFNTNNLWINLKSLQNELEKHSGLLPLSLIINPKEVEGTKVYQLETAMGAAINVFENAKALAVPRRRLAPVKKTNDLLLTWSDAYKLKKNYQLVLNNESGIRPNVNLIEKYYKTIDQLKKHFPHGAPSLKQCTSLNILNEVFFGKNVKIIGDVKLTKKMLLEEQQLENTAI